MPTIDIRGVPHAYELTPSSTNSSSPYLIFIHGWLLSRKYWQPLIEELATDYPCLIYDLRGFGDSQGVSLHTASQTEMEAEYTLAAYGNDLSMLLSQLNIETAWLIGHSFGGSVALWAADLCSERVKGVICLNAGGGIYLKEEFERFRNFGLQLIKRRPAWLLYVPGIDWLFARTMVTRHLDLSWGRQRVIDFLKADEEAARGSLLNSTTEAEVHLLPQIVARLRQPVYFLAGMQDKVMEPKYVHHLASFHQLFSDNAQNVIEIPDCGHLSMLEQPELVCAKISVLLKKPESDDAGSNSTNSGNYFS
ncbi:MAG: alpha/beta hydrolase [Gomphosphaeria aponina SAG 52.96 = DSM 107014]|uniref:Alpha/beta hydrolase n=1 Tax=Gomphosphaeria aponina SAG 52.96 = DSM 107014 TaxID=1521640 RepID=A0A941GQW6_9CHRO|nr:alpha/beta hydrolase [Gomphosphaeria aponina SAG 52.96 = DSM 107014]